MVLLTAGLSMAGGADVFEQGRDLQVIVGDRSRDAGRAGLVCAGCHGRDGRGGRESGAPPIVWSALSEPTGRRPAYDAAGFARALRDGHDPAGRRLQMPRFDGSDATLDALRQHLVALDDRERLGITGDHVTIALPADPALRHAVDAAIADFNDQGGSWGRHVRVGEPAFLDMAALIADLEPRTLAAEQALARRMMAGNPALHLRTTPGAVVLEGDGKTRFIGPPEADVVWAHRQGLDLRAARLRTLAGLILTELRAAGPGVTQTAFAARIARLDLAPAVIARVIIPQPAQSAQ